MPTYRITAPDGSEYEVTGEGTEQEALAHVQQAYRPQRDLKKENPAEYDPSSREYQERYGPMSGRSFAQNFGEGVGKAFVDTGRGVRQLAIEAGDKLNLVSPTMTDLVRGETPTQRVRREASETAAQDAALMDTAGGMTGYVGGQAAMLAVPGGAAAKGVSLAGRMGAAAALGGTFANMQPVTSDQTRAGNTAIGAIAGAAGEGLAAGVGKVAQASSKVTPEIRELARKAQSMGIKLRAEQVSGSRPLAGVSAALDTIPLSGRDASRAAQRSQFNRAVARTFGENTDNLTTAVKSAQASLGAKYDAVLKRYPVNADTELVNGLEDVLQAARTELTDAQFGVITRQVDNILDKVGQGGQIDAQAAYNIKKTLDRVARGQDSSLGYHASELRDTLMDAFNRSLPGDISKNFAKVKQQYGNLISVRKLLKNGADGGITPAALGNVKNLRGELKDVADVGAQFLKEPFGNSGTANRMIGAGILGGAGVAGMLEPATLATTAATLGAARGANSALQSAPVVEYLLAGSPALQRALPYINRALPAATTAGAISSQ